MKIPSISIVLSLFLTKIQAQQSPFYTAERIDAVSYRQNVCERQRRILQGELPLPHGLQGLNLSVVLPNYKDDGYKPLFSLNGEGVIDEEQPGLFSIIMDELAKRGGFTWRQSYGVVDPIDPDVDGNLTWTDLLEWGTQVYDVVVGRWDRSIDRIKREIEFPEGWFDSSIIIVEARKTSKSMWTFLFVFHWSVWVSIAVTVVLTGLLYSALDMMNHEADERQLDKQPDGAVFYSFLIMTGHFELLPTTTPARLASFSLSFLAMLTVSTYTANLVGFLVSRKSSAFIVQSIEDAAKFGIPVCLQGGVALDEYLSFKYPHAIIIRKKTEFDVLRTLIGGGECGVAALPRSSFDLFERNSQINGDCTLYWHGRVESIIPSGLATIVDKGVLCTSLINSVLDYHLLEMKIDGFFGRAWEEHLERVGSHSCGEISAGDRIGSPDDMTGRLGMPDMAGIFVLHVVVCAVSFLIAFGSFLVKYRKDRNSGQESIPSSR